MDSRRTAKQALAPLEANVGIDTLEIRSDDAAINLEPLVLDRDGAHNFDKLPSDDEVITDVTREVGLTPLKPSLEFGYKWFVSDGLSRFCVSMHDLAFLQRVETSAEAFAAGDILRCKLRSRQLRDDQGELRMEHTVLQVRSPAYAPPGYVFNWAEVVGENDLPSVWAAAWDKYARYKATRPGAVWNPNDGSWREVRVRTTQPSPPPPGQPHAKPPRQIEYERKAAELKEDYDSGRITDDVYKLRMLELNREYH